MKFNKGKFILYKNNMINICSNTRNLIKNIVSRKNYKKTQQFSSFDCARVNRKLHKQSQIIQQDLSCKINSTFNKITFNNKSLFCFTTLKQQQSSLIQSLQQYVKGIQMLKKGHFTVAVRQFQMALSFLPKQVQGDQNYKTQYQQLLNKLLQAHIMTDKTVAYFKQIYGQYLDITTKFGQFVSILQQIQKSDFQTLQSIQTQDKLWKQLIRAFAFKNSKQCFGKHIPIKKVNESQDLALKYIGCYLYEKIRNRKNKQREDIYLNTCRDLLKQTEKKEPGKIAKPLSLMASNLLAGDQFLQAQGLMSHSLSVVEQFYVQNPHNLKIDQQYILCKSLMARVFQGVNRKSEHDRIMQQYGRHFDQKKFIIQELMNMNYKSL